MRLIPDDALECMDCDHHFGPELMTCTDFAEGEGRCAHCTGSSVICSGCKFTFSAGRFPQPLAPRDPLCQWCLGKQRKGRGEKGK